MIAGILLAAGYSTRMGQPKALLPYEDITFIDSILNKLAEIKCDPIISILGASAELICQKTHVNSFQCFQNPQPEHGMLSSLKIAIEQLPPSTIGFILALIDHPLVKLETYQKLMEMAKNNPAHIVIPQFYGHNGHPVYFGRPFFESLLNLSLSEGARAVIHENASEIKFLNVEDEGILKDIDSPQDFQREFH